LETLASSRLELRQEFNVFRSRCSQWPDSLDYKWREGDNAAILAAGQTLFLLTDGGELAIARADPKFEVLKKYSVAESPTWRHPVVVGKRLVVKDAANLALLGFD
jgi:hypothetical protein